jgi:transketolase
LATEGIQADVLDMPSLKPLDTTLLLESVRRTGALVTVEDHSIIGGLASAACETLVAGGCMTRFRALGVRDTFTESGPAEAVRARYGLGVENIVAAAKDVRGDP